MKLYSHRNATNSRNMIKHQKKRKYKKWWRQW